MLDEADGLRRTRRLALERLNILTQAVFEAIFGKLIATGRRIPLAESAEEFRYGTSNKAAQAGYPTLRIPNVIGGAINLDDLKNVPVEAREFERLRLRSGDILFVRTNGNPDYVGRLAVVEERLGQARIAASECIFASYLIRARLRPRIFHPVFLQAFLSTGEGRRQIREFAKTSAGQFNINVEGLSALMIPAVGFELQTVFVAQI
jgi:type I restriction enzyme S subunit